METTQQDSHNHITTHPATAYTLHKPQQIDFPTINAGLQEDNFRVEVLLRLF